MKLRSLIILSLFLIIGILFFTFSKIETINIINKNMKINSLSSTNSDEDFILYANSLYSNKKDSQSMSYNTEYLQSLVDRVSNNGGGIVKIPAGTFYFSTSGMNESGSEDYVIMCRDNVKIIGTGSSTILKPYGSSKYGLDMFYFNEFRDSQFTNPQYLVNADFEDFVIDGSEAKCQTYSSAGKGFMINLYKNCDWNNVTVKYTDGTGFGMDNPIDCTITNCTAIGCGKAATTSDGGASGFGIGTGYSPNETIFISNCISMNNKKYGFFFEHQGRFNTEYNARQAECLVVSNCVASGNLYDFGGEKSNDVTYENCKSQGNSTTTASPIHFESTSRRVHIANCIVEKKYNDVLDNSQYYYEPVYWALNNSISDGIGGNTFGVDIKATRMQVITMLWRLAGRPGDVIIKGEVYNNVFQDVPYNYPNVDAIKWAKDEGIISTSNMYFYPDEGCTREDFIIFLWKYAGSPIVNVTNPFTDVQVGSTCEKAVKWALSKGITNGGGSSTKFLPNEICDREDVVTFLYRFANSKGTKFNIKYNLCEGSYSNENPSYYTSGSTSFLLNNPYREGYTFLGWTGSNGSTPSKSVRISTSDVGDKVFTANWERNNYTITFNSNGGTGSMNKTTYTYDVIGSLPENNFTKTNAEFIGWNEKANGTGKSYKNKERIFNLTEIANYNITLYAQWQDLEEEYNVEFKVEHYKENLDGTYTKTEIETYNSYAGVEISPNVKTYEGFTSPSKQTVIIEEDGSTIVKYYYKRNSYKITISNGKGIASTTGAGVYKYQENVKLDANALNGYENVTWSVPTTNFTMPANDLSITVSAQAKKYQITYVLDGGYVTGNPTSYTVEDVIQLNSPTRSGYTFLGWIGSNGNIPQKNVTITLGSTGNKQYTARWEKNSVIQEPNLEVTVNYSTLQLTNQNIEVTITANIPINQISGWNISQDNMKMTKEYSENKSEALTITSKTGKTKQVYINITNIDKQAPEVTISYTYLREQKIVEVVLKSNEKLQDISGWNTTDNMTFTKSYYENTYQYVTVKDIANNQRTVTININQIEEPDNSDDSEEPDNPDDSEEPDNPDDSEEPDNTDDSEEPDNPDDSEEPDNPDDWEELDNPDDSEQPDNPNDSEQLEKPGESVQTDKPISVLIGVEKLEDQKDTSMTNKWMPKTGGSIKVILALIVCISIFGFISLKNWLKYKQI